MEAIQADIQWKRYRRIYSGNDTGGYTVETEQFYKKVSKKVYKNFSLIFQADFVKNQI